MSTTASETDTEPGFETETEVGVEVEAEVELGAQYRIVEAAVTGSARISPSMMRITFGGAQVRTLISGGRDQSLTVFFPRPGEDSPLVPLDFDEGWYGRWRALPLDRRAVMRSYTVRSQDPVTGELAVDFVLHGVGGAAPCGPAAAWAARAVPGDRVILLGPALAANRSIAFRPPPDAARIILAADETALPAVGGILEALPAGIEVKAWVEVPDAGDVQQITTAATAEVEWLVRPPGRRPGAEVAAAVRAAGSGAGDLPYVWIAGESGLVRTLRRHFVRDRGLDRSRVAFTGYWRLGASEEQLRSEREIEAGM